MTNSTLPLAPEDQMRPLAQWAGDPRLPLGRSGKPIGRAALYAWAQRGVKGVRLRVTQAGGCRVCSLRDIQDFFARLSERAGVYQADDEPSETPRSAKQRDRAAARAEEELATLGVC